MAKKKQPKTFQRKGEFAYAFSPADEVRLAYNGWTEVKPPEPEPAPADVEATGDEGETSTSAGATKKTAPAKKAAS